MGDWEHESAETKREGGRAIPKKEAPGNEGINSTTVRQQSVAGNQAVQQALLASCSPTGPVVPVQTVQTSSSLQEEKNETSGFENPAAGNPVGEGPVSEQKIGTFVLDPALENVATPQSMITHVRVQPAMDAVGSSVQQDTYIELEQPVRSATRITLFAIPLELVFKSPLEALQSHVSSPPMLVYPEPLGIFQSSPEYFLKPTPVFLPGENAYTASGAVIVENVRGNFLLTPCPSPEAAGAAAVVLLETDTGKILVDAGMQLVDESSSSALGDEMAGEVARRLDMIALGEAILARNAPGRQTLPYIAKEVQILSIRSTMDQRVDGSVAAVLQAQSEFRERYKTVLREKLTAGRKEWELTQPIAPNNAILEQRWNKYLDEQVAKAMRLPSLRTAEDVGGILKLRDDLPEDQTSEAGALSDSSDIVWEPDDNQENLLIVYGKGAGSSGVLALLPSYGYVLQPKVPETRPRPPNLPEPEPLKVPDIRPTGPLGPGPHVPGPVTPWLTLPATGKRNLMLARLAESHVVMFDAGGSKKAVPLDKLLEIAGRVGSTSIDGILLTHPHEDHTSRVIELILEHNVRAENLVISQSWKDTPVVKKLRNPRRELRNLEPGQIQKLLDLGFKPDWTPGLNVKGQGKEFTFTHLTAEGEEVDIYARPEAHKEFEVETRKYLKNKRKTRPGELADSAGLLYVFGNESSKIRAAVLGDFRGRDILKMSEDFGADALKVALRDVRLIKDFGHHFSKAAGNTVEDIKGINLLLENTLGQNGELTIVVQSSDPHAFRGMDPALAGPEGALLRYLVRQGVRVVFAGSHTTGGSVDISSNVQVSTYGEGVRVWEGEPQVREMHNRLDLLREALRTVKEAKPEYSLEALGLEREGMTADDVQAGLEREIQHLENLVRELRMLAAADLLDARGEDLEVRRKFRRENTVIGRTERDILDDMAVRGPVEQKLSQTVLEHLRAAVFSGRSIALNIEFGHVPRELIDAISHLPKETSSSLAQKYRELADLTEKLEGDLVPPAQRLVVLIKAKELRDELRLALEKAKSSPTPSKPGESNEWQSHLEKELARLELAVQRLVSPVKEKVVKGRDVAGRPTQTEYLWMPGRGKELLMKGVSVFGRGMGALMVIQSVEGLEASLDPSQKVSGIERALQVTHAALEMQIGLKTIAGSHIGQGKFAVLALLEVGEAAFANYETEEDRYSAIAGAVIHGTINLLCQAAGEKIMEISIELPFPADVIGLGLGLAVMMVGDKFFSWLGLDEYFGPERPFEPEELIKVEQKIDSTLDEYRILIGSQQLMRRSEHDLSILGVRDPAALKSEAGLAIDKHLAKAQSKETELTGLFEDAYKMAKEGKVGLQFLDVAAAKFTNLRGLAMRGQNDPQRAELDNRWRRMDQQLQLGVPDILAETIRSIDQWSEIDKEMVKFHDLIDQLIDQHNHGRYPDATYSKMVETESRLGMMLENARYRLDSAIRDKYRPEPLIPKDSQAYQVYTEELFKRERDLAQFSKSAVNALGYENEALKSMVDYRVGPPFPYTFENKEYPETDVHGALGRLKWFRIRYDQLVKDMAQAHPELRDTKTWADPRELEKALWSANQKDSLRFGQLQVLEMTLKNAASQVSSALILTSPPPPALFQQTVESEIVETEQAINARRNTFGLVFRDEHDQVLEKLLAQKDIIFTTEINAAFPSSQASKPGSGMAEAFRDTEFAALHSGSFVQGKKLTTTELQLAEYRKKVISGRMYATLLNPFLSSATHDKQWFDKAMKPIVGIIKWWEGSGISYYTVIAINSDAVSLIGSVEVTVPTKYTQKLSQFQVEQIIAEKKKLGEEAPVP